MNTKYSIPENIDKKYLRPKKFIRDLVHDYVNLTEFQLELIDTPDFQRLKDIRQLTSQQVYPAARHTRFEHSLGVLELTRQAIKHLNQNKILGGKESGKQGGDAIIDPSLQFNAELAALLHDVGHCPFSHLGEMAFDKESVRKNLLFSLRKHSKRTYTQFSELIEKIKQPNGQKIGAVHEQLSCIVILESPSLTSVFNHACKLGELQYKKRKAPQKRIEIDLDFIIRCILGIKYDAKSTDCPHEAQIKNAVIGLINSDIFDMDKLDYIMRDSFFTGVGTPKIDTQRLFRNMYFDNNYNIIFTSRAVPALQNMIDSRDELYLYVYNHHVAVFSEFLYSYILRKLEHNYIDFSKLTLSQPGAHGSPTVGSTFIYSSASSKKAKDMQAQKICIPYGIVPSTYIFSVDAVLYKLYSDSNWLTLLNTIMNNTKKYKGATGSFDKKPIEKLLKRILRKSGARGLNTERETALAERLRSTYTLVDRCTSRNFLKPWWKTVFEFNAFLNKHFDDDRIRGSLGKYICDTSNDGKFSAEFRSQIAKHVVYITKRLTEEGKGQVIQAFEEGDFFVIQRSNRFFDLEQIDKLEIAFKTSEIIGSPTNDNDEWNFSEYYIKFLSNILPQKEYDSIYARDGFYIFSKPLEQRETRENSSDTASRNNHYKEIEQIFVFVATRLVSMGKSKFISTYCDSAGKAGAESTSLSELYRDYLSTFYGNEK